MAAPPSTLSGGAAGKNKNVRARELHACRDLPAAGAERSLSCSAQARLPPEVNRALYIRCAARRAALPPGAGWLTSASPCRNLPFNITAEEMYDIFGKYGAVRQIRLCVPCARPCLRPRVHRAPCYVPQLSYARAAARPARNYRRGQSRANPSFIARRLLR